VLLLPIPLRLLLAAQPELVTPVLLVVHRAITRFLLHQAGLKAEQADSGAVTLIQRFGSVANLNIHLHCLVLEGVYQRTGGEPVFVPAEAANDRFKAVSFSDPMPGLGSRSDFRQPRQPARERTPVLLIADLDDRGTAWPDARIPEMRVRIDDGESKLRPLRSVSHSALMFAALISLP